MRAAAAAAETETAISIYLGSSSADPEIVLADNVGSDSGPTKERADVSPPDIIAELDDDDIDDDIDDVNGVMQTYIKAVRIRLRVEIKQSMHNGLLGIFKDNDWWLRAVHTKKICSLLELPFSEPSYYHDIYAWFSHAHHIGCIGYIRLPSW